MLTLIFAYLLSSFASAQVRFAPIAGQYQAKGDFQYLTTSANYIAGGTSSTTLFGGGKLTRMLGEGEVTYDYSPAIRFWGGFNGGQTTAVVVDTLNSVFSTVTKTVVSSGLNEGYAGGQWWTELQKFDIVPQVDFVYPFSRVNMTSQNPLLGEGAMRFQGGSWAMYPMENDLTPFVYAGLAYRDGGRSMLMPYSVGARYGKESHVWAQVEFRGYYSLTDDSDVNNRPVRDAYASFANGGSYEFYAVNPSRAELAGLIGMHVNQIGFYAGGSKTIYGRNSADDYQFVVGLSFNGTLFNRPKYSDGGGDDFSPEKFNQKPEKYDDSLFQEQITPDEPIEDVPETIRPAPAAKPEVRPATKPRERPAAKPKPAAKPEAPMPNVEMLMKDTQKNLEKRKKSE